MGLVRFLDVRRWARGVLGFESIGRGVGCQSLEVNFGLREAGRVMDMQYVPHNLPRFVPAPGFRVREFSGQYSHLMFVSSGATYMSEDEKVLSFEIERDGDSAVVKCHGRLVLGVSEELYQAVKHILPETKVVVIDLHDLTYVDSMGLGTLVRLYSASKQAGCEFKLLHLGKQLRNLLKMTNLLGVFSQAEDHGVNIA
jgi:anti-sigma B factor antagonist